MHINKNIPIVFVLLLLILSGCGAPVSHTIDGQAETLNPVMTAAQTPGPTPPPQAASPVQKIDSYPDDGYGGLFFCDWIDDDSALCLKSNDALQYALFSLNVQTKVFTPFLSKEEANISSTKFSPDKKHVAYFVLPSAGSDGGEMNLYLMDTDTKKETIVLQNARDFSWIDSERLIVDAWDKTLLADTSNNTTDITQKTGVYCQNGASVIGDALYYIERAETSPVGGDLYALDLPSGKQTLLLSGVETFSPAPDQKTALVLLRQEDGVSLVLIGLDGSIKKALATCEGDEAMMRGWWSPGGNTIAYTVIKAMDDPDNALFIYNVSTAESEKIMSDVRDPDIAWSPSGGKLCVSAYVDESFMSWIVFLN